jgi:hypothetical protein
VRTDVISLAAGLVFAAVAAFFLVADDPSLHDVGNFLAPVVLLVAGATLVAGSLRRSRDDRVESASRTLTARSHRG